MNVKITDAPTIRVDIFIAGDLKQAKQACREWCMDEGACVTVEPAFYIYTGGMGDLWADCGQIARAALNQRGADLPV